MNKDSQRMETPSLEGVGGEVERFIAFSLAGESYAVPLLKVKEVIGLTEITPLPHSPVHFKGIMNLRGLIISVIDLRIKFAAKKAENHNETAIIILDIEPLSLGIIVDSIDNVLGVNSYDIQPPPDMEIRAHSGDITGVIRHDNRLLLVLDIEQALSANDLKALHYSKQKKAA